LLYRNAFIHCFTVCFNIMDNIAFSLAALWGENGFFRGTFILPITFWVCFCTEYCTTIIKVGGA